MTLRLHRGALLSQRRTANGPPSGQYEPPTADSLALVFAGGPYAAPESGAIPLNFGPPTGVSSEPQHKAAPACGQAKPPKGVPAAPHNKSAHT